MDSLLEKNDIHDFSFGGVLRSFAGIFSEWLEKQNLNLLFLLFFLLCVGDLEN